MGISNQHIGDDITESASSDLVKCWHAQAGVYLVLLAGKWMTLILSSDATSIGSPEQLPPLMGWTKDGSLKLVKLA